MARFSRSTIVITLLSLGLGGCFRPLYGSPEFGGLAIQQGLAGVSIDISSDRMAHYIRNELEFGLRGGDPNVAPVTHRLVVTAKQITAAAVVDRLTGTAESGYMTISAKYWLYPRDKTKADTEGDASVLVSYDRTQQRFATTRAARDAEIQGAKQLAEQIKTRIAAYMASKR
jgi:LPS-assembly lipoprotein